MTEEEYHTRAADRISQRDALIKNFLGEKKNFIACQHCESVLAIQYAERFYLFKCQAKCLICNKSLLSEEEQKNMTQLWEDGIHDYETYRKSGSKKEFDPVVSVKTMFSWTSVVPESIITPKEEPKPKKWWQRFF